MTGRSVGSDASPLSCFLFRPRKSREKRRKRSHTNVSNTLVTRPSTPPAQTAYVCFHRRKWVRYSAFQERSHTRAHTPRQGCFGRGWYHYPRTVSHVSETLRGQGAERRTLPLLGLGRVCSPKRRKPAEQRCAYARRCSAGVAAPLGCVIFSVSVEIAACMPCAQRLSACARHGRYHYPRRALRAVETPDGRLSKRLICRFLRSGGRSSPHDSYFLANTQNFLWAVPVANAFALWYDKFSKLEVVLLLVIEVDDKSTHYCNSNEQSKLNPIT